jgi:uncharacterized membrane protein YagU involved in acid resistance
MPSLDEADSVGRLFAAVAVGGLVAGSLDILVASAINEASPATILQAIASGLLGKASYDGGMGTAALGLLLQWLMSLMIAAIYGAAAMRMPALFEKPVRFGALYGVGIFIVMGFIVMPLSAAYPKPQPSISGLVLNLAANILFGLIVALALSLMGVGQSGARALRSGS